MKLFAPKYYNEFKCIADKCTHSCCIGWEIDIDPHTVEKYNTLDCDYGNTIRKSIVGDEPHFALCKGDRCPHLDKSGLCNIISLLGEEYLCDICREHPRFYNETYLGKEVGLGMACEEACRLILNSDCYDEITEIEESDEESEATAFDPITHRALIYSILKNRTASYIDRIQAIYQKYGISPLQISDEEWHTLINELEYLDPEHKELFLCYSSKLTADKAHEVYLERALAYFIYRHCTEAYDYEELCARLGFCLFCERLLSSLISKNPRDVFLFARIISEELEYSTDNTETIMSIFLEKF